MIWSVTWSHECFVRSTADVCGAARSDHQHVYRLGRLVALFHGEPCAIRTTEPSYGKLFVADDDGIRLLVLRAREETPVYVFRWGFLTNYYDLIGVDIASNGSRISLTGFHECSTEISTIACGFMDRSDIYDDQGQFMFSADGYVSFSPNGAWGLEVA
jgi:hypothetical protein